MADLLRVKRGMRQDLPNLMQGEFGFCVDTKELFIGGENGNDLVNKQYVFDVESYGAIPNDDSVDNTLAIQKAINAASVNDGILYFPTKNGKYRITGTLTVRLGIGYKGIFIDGNNARLIYDNSSGIALHIKPTTTYKDGTFNFIQHFDIQNLFIQTTTPNTAIGLKIGEEGKYFDDFHFSKVYGVFIESFNVGILMESVRHINFDNVVVRNPLGTAMKITAVNTFCGDINFSNCEFIAGSSSAIELYTWGSDYESELRGLHFTDCIIYGNQNAPQTVFFNAAGYGRILDIWFTSCALDQGQNVAFLLSAQQDSNVGGVIVKGCYIMGFARALKITSSSSIFPNNISFDGNQCGLLTMAFEIFGALNTKIINNTFEGMTMKSTMESWKNVLISNNIFMDSIPTQYSVYGAASGISGVITGNFGNYTEDFFQNMTTIPTDNLVVANNGKLVV